MAGSASCGFSLFLQVALMDVKELAHVKIIEECELIK
jgi:hypothetical protein